MNTILHERQLEEYYCTLCYAVFDFKRRTVIMANSGLPYPVRCQRRRGQPGRAAGRAAGSFAGLVLRRGRASTSRPGDVYVFCTDGVSEARDPAGTGIRHDRLLDVVAANRRQVGARFVDAIFAAVRDFRGDAPPHDDMTAVVVKITR